MVAYRTYCKIFITVILVVFSLSSKAQVLDALALTQMDNSIDSCLVGNCDDGSGAFYFSLAEAVYEGAFKAGIPEGNGVAWYNNGEKYIGAWQEGYFHGEGQLHIDGRTIEGIWNRGVLQKKQDNSTESNDDLETTYAIIIGISNYPHMSYLKYSDDDAFRMYAHLRSPEGGALDEENIVLLIDEQANQQAIVEAFKTIFSKADDNDRVIVYYSGHGNEQAFLPYDYDGDNNVIKHEELKDIVMDSDAHSKFLMIDACHSGDAFTEKSGFKKYTSFCDLAPGWMVLLSSKKEETSLESEGLRQGVFSHYLLKGLKGSADQNSDSKIRIKELYDYVHYHVSQYTGGRQHPNLTIGEGSSELVVSRVKD